MAMKMREALQRLTFGDILKRFDKSVGCGCVFKRRSEITVNYSYSREYMPHNASINKKRGTPAEPLFFLILQFIRFLYASSLQQLL